MSYTKISQLPSSARKHLPKHALEIYMEAFNHAEKEYKDPKKRRGGAEREEVARKVAWAAVKKGYEKGTDGKWHKKV